jgi:hypothetical protein
MKSATIKFLQSLLTDDRPKGECDLLQFAIRCVREHKVEEKNAENESYILELFEKFYKVYCRKGGREQAKKTWRKKLIKLKTKEDILFKARKIAKVYSIFAKEWEERGTDNQFIPLCSSFLNSNIPDGE